MTLAEITAIRDNQVELFRAYKVDGHKATVRILTNLLLCELWIKLHEIKLADS